MESIGEKLGEGLAGIVNNDINDPEIKLRNPDSFNEKAGFLIYEKIFNR